MLTGWAGKRAGSWYGLTMTGFEQLLEQTPAVVGGALVLRGTRVPLRTVLASLAEGASNADILRAFPTLTAEHVRAAVMFVAARALEDLNADADEADSGDEGSG